MNDEALGEFGVRGLLEMAVDDVVPPAGGDRTGEVFARAARVRTGRRALAVAGVAAATVAAVAAGTVGLPGSGGGGTEAAGPAAPSRTSPAPVGVCVLEQPACQRAWLAVHGTLPPGIAPYDPKKGKDALEVMRRIVPKDVGTVTQQQSLAHQNQDNGDLDGNYLVRNDGTVGGLRVVWGLTLPYMPACGGNNVEHTEMSCVATDLPGGSRLFLKEFPAGHGKDPNGTRWGRYYQATIALGNGRMLLVDDIAGFTGPGSPGPGMAAPPLTKAQLTAFAQRPELKVGANLKAQTGP
jgi:hypothetical protein